MEILRHITLPNIKVPSGGFGTSGSLTYMWHTSFGPSACLHFGTCPLFLFLSLSWVLSFFEVWYGFIT